MSVKGKAHKKNASLSFERAFRGSILKIQRANRHINELNTLMNEFVASKPYGFVRYDNPEDHTFSLIFDPQKPLPEEIPLIAGDALHNLRSALDHLAVEIVSASRDVSRQEALQFPFHKMKKTLERDSNVTAIDEALPGARSAIIEKIQPFLGGRGNLYGLNALDKIDKHNLIIPTRGKTTFSDFNILLDGNSPFTGGSLSLVFDAERKTMPFRFSKAREVIISQKTKAYVDIIFGNGDFFRDDSIIPTLTQLSQTVRESVEIFRRLIP